MGTNPIGQGTKNVTVNMPSELRDRLSSLASASGLSLSAYIRAVLTDAATRSTTVSQILNPDSSAQRSNPPLAEIVQLGQPSPSDGKAETA